MFTTDGLHHRTRAAQQWKDIATQTESPFILETQHQASAAEQSQDMAVQTEDRFQMNDTLCHVSHTYAQEFSSPKSLTTPLTSSYVSVGTETTKQIEDSISGDSKSSFTDSIITTITRIVGDGSPGLQSRAVIFLKELFEELGNKSLIANDLDCFERVLSAYHLFFGAQSILYQETVRVFCTAAASNGIAKPGHATLFMQTLRAFSEGEALVDDDISEAKRDIDVVLALWCASAMCHKDIQEAIGLIANINRLAEAEEWLTTKADIILYSVCQLEKIGCHVTAQGVLLAFRHLVSR